VRCTVKLKFACDLELCERVACAELEHDVLALSRCCICSIA